MRVFYRLVAEIIFLFHIFVGLILVFFWQSKILYPIYLFVLAATLLSNIFLKVCFLSEWELYFRKKVESGLDYNTFLGFYFYKFFNYKPNPSNVHKVVLIILWSLVVLNISYWFYIYAHS